MFLKTYSFRLSVFEVITKKIHNKVLDIDLNGIWHTGVIQHQYNHTCSKMVITNLHLLQYFLKTLKINSAHMTTTSCYFKMYLT